MLPCSFFRRSCDHLHRWCKSSCFDLTLYSIVINGEIIWSNKLSIQFNSIQNIGLPFVMPWIFRYFHPMFCHLKETLYCPQIVNRTLYCPQIVKWTQCCPQIGIDSLSQTLMIPEIAFLLSFVMWLRGTKLVLLPLYSVAEHFFLFSFLWLFP